MKHRQTAVATSADRSILNISRERGAAIPTSRLDPTSGPAARKHRTAGAAGSRVGERIAAVPRVARTHEDSRRALDCRDLKYGPVGNISTITSDRARVAPGLWWLPVRRETVRGERGGIAAVPCGGGDEMDRLLR